MKRALDVLVATPLLILSAPLILLLMLIVSLDSRGSPLFTQVRVGRSGRPFTIYKLRTFYSDQHGLFPNEEIRWKDPRVTRAGSLLRRCKLDELPQLLNVVRGDMSLVGPRPDIPLQAQHYGPFESRRLEVRPGLTGIAQISGNTFLEWKDRIQLDRWYVDHQSLQLDMKILLHTLPVMLRGEHPADDPFGLRS